MTDPLILAITRRRVDLGWSQFKLAAAAGMAASKISPIESSGNPTLRTLRVLCDALGCDLVLVPRPDVRVSKPGGIWDVDHG